MARMRTKNLFETEEQVFTEPVHVIRLAFDSGVDGEFDYSVPEHLWPVQNGCRVEAPFGRSNKLQTGFCVDIVEKNESFAAKGRLKRIKKIVDDAPLLNKQLLDLGKWISDYYVCPLGQVLAAMIPAAVKKNIGQKQEKFVYLNANSESLSLDIKGKKQKKIIEILKDSQAFDATAAIRLGELVEKSESRTDGAVKKLAGLGIVKFASRTVHRSLPVIPESLTLKSSKVVPNNDQKNALSLIVERVDSNQFGIVVIHGVTDSGKTEVYIRAIEKCIATGKKAIVLLPEIALTAQTVQRFASRFEKIAVMHSQLTAAQRNTQWQKIRSGDADVVIGARSAVFAPLNNLGLIVVDEEHEPSYKQDKAPRYNGRDVAIKRAQLADAICVLGSATPSLETIHNCNQKKYYALVRLPKRVMDLPLPEMKLVDMCTAASSGNQVNLISEPLEQCLTNVLARGEQAILLLNRRGYSNFIYCPSCRHTLHCQNCDVTLTFHKAKLAGKERMADIFKTVMKGGYAICHYCNSQTLVSTTCPLCDSNMTMIGLGSQRLEEQLQQKWSDAKIARIDSDSMSGKDYYHLLRDFSEGRIDILAGTQILAKGLHFPNVTVVGIISADTSLYLPDFRANERTFQMISQVAGRTGRSEKKGVVFVQTFFSDQPAINFALKNDFQGFVTEELRHRKTCQLPPYGRLARMILRDTKFDRLEQAAKILRSNIDRIINDLGLRISVRGPMEPTIARIQRFHRLHIIIQSPLPNDMRKFFTLLRQNIGIGQVKIIIDIDPVNLL
ncbi:MAG: primosomal protein N' [Phycisphaerae bacterium]|nr:primosomal protein N' [Phycisphaerae bacterium]